MKPRHFSAALAALAALMAAGVAAGAVAIVRRKPTSPLALKKAGCSDADAEKYTTAAMAAAQTGGQSGAAAGPQGAGIGAAAGAVTGLASYLSGPCGAAVEKKVSKFLAHEDKQVRETANKVLRQIDVARRKTQDVVTLGPQRRDAGKVVKKAGGDVVGGVKKTLKKVFG